MRSRPTTKKRRWSAGPDASSHGPSLKHSSAVANQSKAAGISRNAPRIGSASRKGGAGSDTGWLGGTASTERGSAGKLSALGREAVAAARVARSRPNFLLKCSSHGGDAHAPGLLDEVEDIVAAGVAWVRMNSAMGAGIARQQLAVAPSGQCDGAPPESPPWKRFLAGVRPWAG